MGFRDPGFPLIEAQDSGSESTLGTKFGIASIHARLDFRNNHRNYASVNSTCTHRPHPPPGYCGAFARLVSPPLHCPGAGHLPTPRPFPSFWHARAFLSEYKYTEGFTGKKKQIGSSVKDRNKLKRVVKACSRFYACISSLLIKPELHSEIGAIDVNQRFLVIESNFCWYYLKNTLSYL